MDTRRDFLKKASLLSGGAGLLNILPASIAKAMAIDPAAGSTYLDAEHIVLLMQENRSFDHTYGALQGVRGFNDPRALKLANNKPVWLQTNNKGETFAPFRLDIKNTNATWMESLPHAWSDQVDARNHGRYDKWLDSKPSHVEQYKSMPLTMGYYSREDIPFYYSLADAFTVCDHNFCSSLTGTTPNRLYFWTGTIRDEQKASAMAHVWNQDADDQNPVSWATFPERLEENKVSWKIYQNEITTDSGLKGEEESWLSNFGDNALEYFSQYKVKADAATLTGKEKSLHEKAFCTNKKDPQYRELEILKYTDEGKEQEVKVPKGDILFQFREDVQNGQLPMVSWLVAPQQFSDHPSSAWYGAWYISEVMDILTSNPEVWKKTIFILTYDENDGYFDHLPPFVAPHPAKENTGKASAGIDTSVEWVSNARQQSSQTEDVRESPIGLGYRVPMVVASPWSRGGWVNSQVFDHTSSILFLEKFLSHKLNRRIVEPQISAWRRAICGDLSSVFRPYNGEKMQQPKFLERNEFIESIHKAQFRNAPSQFNKVDDSSSDTETLKKYIPQQEKGTRSANAIPYELFADGNATEDKFVITMKALNRIYGKEAAGAPFTIYARGKYKGQLLHNRNYAINAGDQLQESFSISDFENGTYHFEVYGPNGFFRSFQGNEKDPEITITADQQLQKLRDRTLLLRFSKSTPGDITVNIIDNAYKKKPETFNIKGQSVSPQTMRIPLKGSSGWYDLSVKIIGNQAFEKRFAGCLENGEPRITDPLMGGAI